MFKFFALYEKQDIMRRYIIMNSFDGALTILGIVLASFFAGIKDPNIIILPSIGAAIAMCISGIWGAYAAEAAESTRDIKELEKHLLRKLKDTVIEAGKEHSAFIIALVDGISQLIVSIVIIVPFFLAKVGSLGIETAYYISFFIIAIILFNLGIFAGKIAKQNTLLHGAKMLLAGLVIGLIFYILLLLGML